LGLLGLAWVCLGLLGLLRLAWRLLRLVWVCSGIARVCLFFAQALVSMVSETLRNAALRIVFGHISKHAPRARETKVF
jgi:hypothetical protein